MVGRTARRHKLFSEAAKRWERGVDPAAGAGRAGAGRRAADRARRRHGRARRSSTSTTSAPRTPISLPADLPTRRIGVDVPAGAGGRPAGAGRLHGRAGADRCPRTRARSACRGVGTVLSVTPPTWRPDLTDPADLVEEVVRLDGYDDVPSVLPTAPARPRPDPDAAAAPRGRPGAGRARLRRGARPTRSCRRTLADQLGLPADDPRRRAVRLANPLSEEEPLLRTSLLAPLLGTLKRNLGRGHRDLALYEIGAVFHPRVGAGAPPAMGVDRRPDRRGVRRRRRGRAGAAVARRRGARRRPRPGRLVGRRAAPAGWADAIEAARGRAGRRRHPRRRGSTVRGRRARAVAPGPLRRAASVDGVGRRARRRAAPGRGARRWSCRRRTCAMELDLDALPAAAGDAGAGGLRLPAGADRRGAGGGRRGAGGRGAAGAGGRRRRAAGGRCGCSTCTPARSSARAASRWRTS